MNVEVTLANIPRIGSVFSAAISVTFGGRTGKYAFGILYCAQRMPTPELLLKQGMGDASKIL